MLAVFLGIFCVLCVGTPMVRGQETGVMAGRVDPREAVYEVTVLLGLADGDETFDFSWFVDEKTYRDALFMPELFVERYGKQARAEFCRKRGHGDRLHEVDGDLIEPVQLMSVVLTDLRQDRRTVLWRRNRSR